MTEINDYFMEQAVNIAKMSNNDIPVGAVLVKNNEIIAKACNQKEKLQQATKHAEIIVIEEASKKFNNWRLEDCTLYVTLEPCPMCAWAILQARIKNIFFGSYDMLYGAFGSKINLCTLINSKTNIKGGILEEKCNNILDDYFKKMRKNDN